MLLRSILLSLIAAAFFVSAAYAISPKKVAVDIALDPDCSDVVLHWTWRPVEGQARVDYFVLNLSTGIGQGTFRGPAVSEGDSEASLAVTAFVLSPGERQRFQISTVLFDSAGNVLLSGEKTFVLPCNGP